MMKYSLILLASLSACVEPGDFCDVVSGPILFSEDTGRVILATDGDAAKAIAVQNRYGAARCGW